jgi:hypothetical protein
VEKKKRKKKRSERGQGRLLHPSNVTRRLDLGLKILSIPRQSLMLHDLSFSFRIPPQKSQLSFVSSHLFVSYSALETQNESFVSRNPIINGVSPHRTGFDPRAVNVKCMEYKVALPYSPLTVALPLLHTDLLYHRRAVSCHSGAYPQLKM